jgi:branched-chain amino acid transport system substrate-binding protein
MGGTMFKWKKRALLGVAIMSVSAMTIAACGGGDSQSTGEDSGGSSAAAVAGSAELGRFVEVAPPGGTMPEVKLGVTLPSSGSGSAYAVYMQRGTELGGSAEGGASATD